ncbi:MAG TPA: glycoside hydrolase family 16 protein, partial [Bryobacteraceae bacterium]|nr:glycoside hydrolase family 16 protein [Bryobacteraceae bacterium]
MLRYLFTLIFTTTLAAAQSGSGWNLVWSDEFNGPAGQLPDSAKWTYDLGYDCCGNNEIETYTQSTNNIFQDGKGNLVIRALKDSAGNYTSGRIKTQGLFSFTYGRAEARIKLPYGKGIWPAFWMLGANITSVGWPQCGEVDIMENFGPAQNDLSNNAGSLHGPGYTGAAVGQKYTLPFGETVSDDYHIYAIEWSPNSMQYFVDGTLYETQTRSTIPSGTQWVFNNQPFFLILNQAIGGPNSGDFIGTPDSTTPFPSDMIVDWVRVYQTATVSDTTPVITPGRVLNAASYLGSMAPGSLAALWGTSLSDKVYTNLFDSGKNAFPTTVAGVSVT